MKCVILIDVFLHVKPTTNHDTSHTSFMTHVLLLALEISPLTLLGASKNHSFYLNYKIV